MSAIRFTSELPASRRAELDRLLYFNANQDRVDRPLRETMQQFGTPSMVQEGDRLRFTVSRCPVQTLYALDDSEGSGRLAAVAIYTREDVETLTLLFLAVHEQYTTGGAFAERMVAPQMLDALRSSAERTKGIRWLRLAYHPKGLRIPVRRRAG